MPQQLALVVVYGNEQLPAESWKSEVDLNSSSDVRTFARECETLAEFVEVGYCRNSRRMVVDSQAAETVVAATVACIASEDTWRMEWGWTCQTCDRRIEVGNLHSSVGLLVFQSFHFQARDLFLELPWVKE